MSLRVVNVKTSISLKPNEELIYVANSMPNWEKSPLGKPYWMSNKPNPLEFYKNWVLEQISIPNSPQREELLRIADKVVEGTSVALGCWCKPKNCHADFLLELIHGVVSRKLLKKHLHFVTGDATSPTSKGHKYIVHICNDQGGWGRGFVLALSRKWKQPEESYRRLQHYTLGSIQSVPIDLDTTVVNMIAQHGYRNHKGQPPIRYQSLESCLSKVAERALEDNASVHMPRIGCGLAGGKWEEVEKIIRKTLTLNRLNVWVYDLP